ncbi:ribonuclease inhibitor [Pedobacter sp. Leaf170]|uniref:ribonuclease inhibitor n=1 Tax=Pedobacter sp. Leaf170 TaxID=2876558 RepID=UPI001E36D842|nr:ribonuclease inhibitor [Pedobacter sp. Leaf170]
MDEHCIGDNATISSFAIEGKNIDNIFSFYQEINRALMFNEAWQLGESLDGLNDLLYGGFGILKVHRHVRLIWIDAALCRQTLGYETTKAYYLQKLIPGSPFNRTYHQQKLAELEAGIGQTYFEIVLGIFADHPNIELICK